MWAAGSLLIPSVLWCWDASPLINLSRIRASARPCCGTLFYGPPMPPKPWVQAIDSAARSFYLRFGFSPSPVDEMRLILLMKDLRAFLRTQ